MSTSQSQSQNWSNSAALDISSTPAVPFSRLVRVEMRKMADTRAGLWLLGIVLVVSVGTVAMVLAFAPPEGKTFATFLGVTATPQGFLLPVLGVLLVTSEWGQRAALTTFTLVPDRGRVVRAKAAAAVLVGLAAILLAFAAAALATLLGGQGDAWDGYTLGDAGAFALFQTLGVVQGLAFGMVFLNSAAAIATYLVLPTAFSVVSGVVRQAQDVRPWLDLGTAQVPLLEPGGMSAEQWGQLATGSALWIGVPLALGAWRVLHAEVR